MKPSKPVISSSAREGLSRADDREVVRSLIENELPKHDKVGITAPRMAELVGVSAVTARIHLEQLVVTGEAYRVEASPKLFLYMPNGRLAHPESMEPIKIGDKHYTFKFIKNVFGEMVLVQEKTQDAWGTWKTAGGIVIPKANLADFAAQVVKVCQAHAITETTASGV